MEGLALQGASSQTVEVGAGDKVQVTWPVKALSGNEAGADGIERATVRMWATAGDLYDAREDTLPVYHYTTPEVVATAGLLPEPGVRQEIIQLPGAFDPTQGELTVQLDGSLTAVTQDALDYLEHYPYECVEQTVSRFLPNVVTWQALEEMGLERPELRQKLAQMVGIGLQRLYAQQHYDGGWGWWTYDESNPYLTAYVLHGHVGGPPRRVCGRPGGHGQGCRLSARGAALGGSGEGCLGGEPAGLRALRPGQLCRYVRQLFQGRVGPGRASL